MLKVIVGLLIVGAMAMYLFVVPLCGCSTFTPGFAAELRSETGFLQAAQEHHRDVHGTFSRDLEALEWFVAHPRVRVDILHADGDGWAARARHEWFEDGPGKYRGADCVAAYGAGLTLVRTSLKARAPTRDRPIVCDMDGWRSGQSVWQRSRWENSD